MQKRLWLMFSFAFGDQESYGLGGMGGLKYTLALRNFG
jgi:hypothetical protein